MHRPDQEWECTIQRPNGERELVVVVVPVGMAQASAEVKALRRVSGAEHDIPDGYRCTSSRFLREVTS